MATAWNSDRYWHKAKMYVEKAEAIGQGSWEHIFWCALSLEHLARGALCRVHPVLNADPQNEGQHILYGLGIEITGEPKVIPMHSVLGRLERVLKNFGKAQRKFCDYLVILRNREIHTADVAFDEVAAKEWQASFYEVCKILSESMGKTLDDLLGDKSLADAANRLIEGKQTKKKSDILKSIQTHSLAFKGLTKDQKRQRKTVAVSKAKENSEYGKIWWPCPSCKLPAEVFGNFVSQSKPIYDFDRLATEHRFLTSALTCDSCGLKLKDHEAIQIAKLDPTFTELHDTNLHEIYQPEHAEEYDNM